MSSIREFMADDHRHCDDVFAEAEQAIAKGDLSTAAERFAAFRQATMQHFAVEESLLFPSFESKTGMRMGPTQVMRMEHVQMRELMDAARDALAAGNADDYAGHAETLLIMMQQHNMKEENILYPMCDQHLAYECADLLPQLQEGLREGRG